MAEQFVDRVRAVKTRTEARLLVEREVRRIVRAEGLERPLVDTPRLTKGAARRGILSNIGYMTGYMDAKTSDRVMDLFETEHPFFGREHPDPRLALSMGKRWGKLTRTKRGRARMDRYMAVGNFAGMRAWVREGICPQCFAVLDEVCLADCPNARHKKR
jgi:hypothetical protein